MKKINFRDAIFILLALSFSNLSFGEEKILGKVKQVSIEKKIAAIVLESGHGLSEGETLVLTSTDLKQCDLKIVKINPEKNIAIANISTCSFANEIKVGQAVEKSLLDDKDYKAVEKFEEKVPAVQPVGSETTWRFGLGLSLGTDATVEYEDIITESGEKGSAELDYSNVLSLEFDARYMQKYGWGFIGGLTIDGKRKLTGGNVKISGHNLAVPSDDPSKIQSTVLYANAVYRWEDFYIPFGLNYSFIEYDVPSASTSSVDASGAIGGQFGIGYYATSNLALELYGRTIGIRLKSATDGATDIDFGKGSIRTAQFAVKYFF